VPCFTLDKMMNGRKTRNAGTDDSDRKHLTGREVERLIEATKGSRNEARDRCLMLLMFRHGLRVSEACRMKLDQVDTESRVLHVARFEGRVIDNAAVTRRRAAGNRGLAEERARMKPTGKTFFVSEQRKPLHRSTVNLALRKYSAAASLPLLAHPHCCAMPAASPLPIRARMRGSFRIISATRTFSTRSGTPPPIRPGLKSSGGENATANP
jgi:type 1 fimbriae regulatory protein FimB